MCPWARFDDEFPDHPKVLAAGPLAAWLHVCAICYACRYLTDGFIPHGQVRRLADVEDPTLLVGRLVSSGLWEVVPGGYRVHDFLEYQPAKAGVEHERELTKKRTAEWRARQESKRNGVRDDVRDAVGDDVTHGVRNGIRTGAPARPGPAHPGPYPGPARTGVLHPNPPPGAEAGIFPLDVIERLSRLPTNLNAEAFHQATAAALVALGFDCEVEVTVADRGDGHAGRLDLVAERDGLRIALELDDRTPRAKSLAKLAGALDCQLRAVVLRCPADGPLPDVGRSLVVIGAGRWDQRAQRSSEGETEPSLTPATDDDVALWERARDVLTLGWLPSNVEKVRAFEVLGRGADGGLRLRAPPWARDAVSPHQVRAALINAGDAAGKHAQIVTG